MPKVLRFILSIFFGILIAILINIFTEYLFIVDSEFCYEYRFPSLSWLLDLFYEGHHHDTNLLNFLLTLLLGIYIAYLITGKLQQYKK